MLSSGNGRPEICALNLLKIMRYEVPYDRIRGIPLDIVDMPQSDAIVEFIDAATWNIDTYEPRISSSAVISAAALPSGEAEAVIQIHRMMGRP